MQAHLATGLCTTDSLQRSPQIPFCIMGEKRRVRSRWEGVETGVEQKVARGGEERRKIKTCPLNTKSRMQYAKNYCVR